MIKAAVIFGLCFTVGNIVWPLFNEPKLFYVPLAIFISLLIFIVKKNVKSDSKYLPLFVNYLLLLSYGNIVKQVMYTERIKQVNDYIWGGLVTVWLLFNLIKLKKWGITTNQPHGRK